MSEVGHVLGLLFLFKMKSEGLLAMYLLLLVFAPSTIPTVTTVFVFLFFA
jgi:hypothetical protein